MKKNIYSIVLAITVSLTALSLSAQPMSGQIKEKALIDIYGSLFEIDVNLDIPEGEANLQHCLSQELFATNNNSVKEAYEHFCSLWEKRPLNESMENIAGKITIKLAKEYEIDGRLACYRLYTNAEGFPRDTLGLYNGGKDKALQFGNMGIGIGVGVDEGLIYDLQSHSELTLDQVLSPQIKDKIVSKMPRNGAIWYVEDWCFSFTVKKGEEGRLVFNNLTEQYFTDYFKQLVKWGTPPHDDANPRFLHGEEGLESYFRYMSKFPLADNLDSIADIVQVSLHINEDGTAVSPKIVSSSITAYDEEALKLCKNMPKWRPAYRDGHPVETETIVKIAFNKVGWGRAFSLFSSSPYNFDVMPIFPGGNHALVDYISNSLTNSGTPQEEGRVLVKFYVDEVGSIKDVEVIEGLGKSSDKEVVRIIKSMPKWKPGLRNGKATKMEYIVPIVFGGR